VQSMLLYSKIFKHKKCFFVKNISAPLLFLILKTAYTDLEQRIRYLGEYTIMLSLYMVGFRASKAIVKDRSKVFLIS